MSAHNLCFEAKIRKFSVYTPVYHILLYNSGVKGGIHNTDMYCFKQYLCLLHLNLERHSGYQCMVKQRCIFLLFVKLF